MPSTPGEALLPGVKIEQRAIKRALQDTYKVSELERPIV